MRVASFLISQSVQPVNQYATAAYWRRGSEKFALKHRWKLLTFGAGPRGHQLAAERLTHQAQTTQMFDGATLADAGHLRANLPLFWEEHADFVNSSSRGFGYWLWKPFIILRELRSLPPRTHLAYLDAGCVLNDTPASRQRLQLYKQHALDHGAWATELVSGPLSDFANQAWCKADAMAYLKATSEIREADQVQAGILLLKNDARSIELVERWCEVATADHYRYLDDSPSLLLNHPSFIEHRHDQALFSILFRQFCLIPEPDPTRFPGTWHSEGKDYPIWSPRWTFTFPFDPRLERSLRVRVETNRRLGPKRLIRKAFLRVASTFQ